MFNNKNFFQTKFNSVVKISFIFLFFTLFAGVSCSSSSAVDKDKLSESNLGWELVPEILKNIIPPKFPNKDFVITKYGALADGKTLCTDAFKKAIDVCSNSGGGRVVVPQGEFLTGAIHLKSNVNLHISKGAVIKFSTDPIDYLPVVQARWEGVDLMNYSPLIYAFNQKNIALTGEGLLDGQADNEHWWMWKGKKAFGATDNSASQNDSLSRPRLMQMNDEGVPVKERIFGEGTYLRPTFVELYKCENILIQNVTLKMLPFGFYIRC